MLGGGGLILKKLCVRVCTGRNWLKTETSLGLLRTPQSDSIERGQFLLSVKCLMCVIIFQFFSLKSWGLRSSPL
jgi:hypothetical protein